MQKENRMLLDEALYEEPIKNTFRLSWEFIVLNRKFTLTVMSLLLLLNIMTSFLGLLAMLFSGVFSMVIQIYVAKLIYNSKDINTFIEESKNAKVESVVSENILVATGGYLGEIVLMFATLLLFSMFVQTLGFDFEQVKKLEDLQALAEVVALPLLTLLLLISYIHPLVQAKISMAKDFKEGFSATFSIFSVSLWSSSFTRVYLKYIVLLLSLVFLAALFLGILITIPFVNILANFMIIIGMYIYMVVMSIAAMMGKRMVEQSS